METSMNLLRPNSAHWLRRLLQLLYPYRPRFYSRQFWAVQGLVALVAVLHFAIESLDLLGHVASHPHALTFVPMTMFFVPVVYAGLNFGLGGALATAAWCSVLVVPSAVLFHSGPELYAELVQLAVVDFVGFFVGQRVDREAHARQRAEDVGSALRSSEAMYRSLFTSSPVPVLLLEGKNGVITQANAATAKLMGVPVASVEGRELSELVGPENARHILEIGENGGAADRLPEGVFTLPGDSPLLVEPMITRVDGDQGRPASQLVLRDVTSEMQQQAGLRAYAAYVVQAQEEERQRIARELHDDVVQRVILLVRHLDTMQGLRSDSSQIELKEDLQTARLAAEELAGSLRGFAQDLRPPMLEDLGLVTSVRRSLRDLEDRTGVTGNIEVLGRESRLHPDFELTAFRIAQEAIRNAERHASPSLVTARLKFTPKTFTLEIADDGAGFDAPGSLEGLVSSGHLGLLGMTERASLIGGNLQIDSERGQGTKVVLTAPTEVMRRTDGFDSHQATEIPNQDR